MLKPEQLHPDDVCFADTYPVYVWGKFFIARKYQPKMILEIGVRAGYSAFGFLTAAPGASYIGLDCSDPFYGGQDKRYMDHAKVLLKDFDTTLIELNTQDREDLPFNEFKFDLIHVDGDHSEAGALHDLNLVLPYLASDGLIVIDDIDRAPPVVEAVKNFITQHGNLDHKYIESFNGDTLIAYPGVIRNAFSC